MAAGRHAEFKISFNKKTKSKQKTPPSLRRQIQTTMRQIAAERGTAMPLESKRLKVSSILLLIFNTIGFFMLIVQLAQLGRLTHVSELDMSGLVAFVVISGLGGVVFNYIVGGFGLKYWNVPEKAHICFYLGIALIIFHIATYVAGLIVVANITARLGGSPTSSGFFNFAIGFILPIIYTTGAAKIKER